MHREPLAALIVVHVSRLFAGDDFVVSGVVPADAEVVDEIGDLVLQVDERGDHGLDAALDVGDVGAVFGGEGVAGAAGGVFVVGSEVYVTNERLAAKQGKLRLVV